MENFKKISSYAAVTCGIDGKEYLGAFEKLLLALIEKKKYSIIDASILVEDFSKEYAFKTPYFPMKELLGRLKHEKFIEKRPNSFDFTPNYPLIEKLNLNEKMGEIDSDCQDFFNGFLEFSKQKFNKDFSLNQLDFFFTNFLDSITENFLQDIGEKTRGKNTEIEFYFFSYIKQIKENDQKKFSFFESVIFGNILTSYISYNENSLAKPKLNKLHIYIDADFAFRLLGVDEIDRQQVYLDLLVELKKQGVKIHIFEHTYLEMINIIDSCEKWVNNPDFDIYKASITATYFLSNGFSVEMIREFSSNLKRKLIALEVSIESHDYPSIENSPFFLDKKVYEANIYESIKQMYLSNGPKDREFVEESLWRDARSLFFIYHFRQGNLYTKFSDVRHLFLTTNYSITKVASEINKNLCGDLNAIPAAITDVFLGTILWLNNPNQMETQNLKLIAPQVFFAFQPSNELLKKMMETFEKIKGKAENDISPDLIFEMKTNKVVMQKVIEETGNSAENFDESTPKKVIEAIIRDERKKAEKDFEEKLQSEHQNVAALSQLNLNQQLDFLIFKKQVIDQKIRDAEEDQNDENDFKSRVEKRFFVYPLILIVILVSVIVLIWLKCFKTDIGMSFFSLFALLLSIIFPLIPLRKLSKIKKWYLRIRVGFYRKQRKTRPVDYKTLLDDQKSLGILIEDTKRKANQKQ